MNATRMQINVRNGIALALVVVVAALGASLLMTSLGLVIARPSVASSAIADEAAVLVENPELMVSRRYTASSETATEAARLAENPELMVSRLYAASSKVAVEAARLAENPELVLARGYVPPGGWTHRMPQHLKLRNKVDPDTDIGLLEFFTPQTKGVSTSCSDVVNPDRVALDRNYGTFTSAWTNMVNPDLVELDRNYGTFTSAWTNCPSVLAANPELPVARRYAPPGGWTHQHLDDY